jgi:O-antigen/teichoic acid export membrane protein
MVFGRRPNNVAISFIKNLGYVFIGFSIAKLLSVIFQIYLGRVLGVVEYGKFTVVISLVEIFSVPMLMGISASMMKYIAERKNERVRKDIVTSGIFLIFIFTLIFASVFYIASPNLAVLTSVTNKYVFAAIVLALLYAPWVVSQKIYQGIGKMKKLSVLNVVLSSVAFALTLVIFYFVGGATAPVLGFGAAYAVSSLFVIPELKRYLRFGVNWKWVKTLLSYGVAMVLGLISLAFADNINKIFLNVFLSFHEVGIYQAYFFSTLNVSAFFSLAVVTVLFPEASGYKNKRVLFNQTNRLFKMSPVLYIIILSISSVILLLFGSAYSFSLPLLLIFVFASIINFAYTIYSCLCLSIGIKGVKTNTFSIFLVSVINLFLAFFMIPNFGLYGAVISTTLSYSFGLFFLRRWLNNILPHVANS